MSAVVHAQGDSLYYYGDMIFELAHEPCSVPDWVGVVTCCNDPDAILIHQLERNDIGYRNAGWDVERWSNAMKPGLISQALDTVSEPYALVLDALDVVLDGDFIRAVPGYMGYGKPILFGATRNNSPPMDDGVTDRADRGVYCYLNAGTAFGPREALSVFYRLVADIVTPQDDREQGLVRRVFSRCQSWVDYDWRCVMFQTLG